jgi:catechol 2,3-dioxygenase-like lactoylglutathione lyase family enzyme
MISNKKAVQSTIGHVSIEVSSLKSSRGFYEVLLTGLDCRLMVDERTTMAFANRNFQVWVCETQPPRVRRQCPTGEEIAVADHLAILVSDEKIVNAIAAKMKMSGFSPLFPPEGHPQFTQGYYAVSFCDPDNYVIEIYTAPGESSTVFPT